eukprot:TRINITY_DN6576_c0_g1_i4.p2 TRINITY_DN6576_c0_g1~~TRINITY_DN6576_c0_g1_i4.p2  ORF type:complete len:211 (+),score=-13.01 TRINITY_DN6576_c0_g1_i4:2480-3112(+)
MQLKRIKLIFRKVPTEQRHQLKIAPILLIKIAPTILFSVPSCFRNHIVFKEKIQNQSNQPQYKTNSKGLKVSNYYMQLGEMQKQTLQRQHNINKNIESSPYVKTATKAHFTSNHQTNISFLTFIKKITQITQQKGHKTDIRIIQLSVVLVNRVVPILSLYQLPLFPYQASRLVQLLKFYTQREQIHPTIFARLSPQPPSPKQCQKQAICH